MVVNRIKRIFITNLLAIPGMVVNYITLVLLIGVFHFSGLWILSGVLVADLIGLSFNAYMTDWNIRLAMKFSSYRELVLRE